MTIIEDEDEIMGSNHISDNVMARSSGNISLRRLKKRVQILDEFLDDKFDMEDSEDNYWEKDLRKRTLKRSNRQGGSTRSNNTNNNNHSNHHHSNNHHNQHHQQVSVNTRRGGDDGNFERDEERGGRLLRKRSQKPNLEQSIPQRSLKKLKVEDDEYSEDFDNEDFDQKNCLRCG
jgi:hypothetical protein